MGNEGTGHRTVGWAAAAALVLLGPGATQAADTGAPDPWPAIRAERIRTLLPGAMERAGVDAWVVVCRENANDPLALHVGGENAGGTAVFLFHHH